MKMNTTKYTNNELLGIMGDYPRFCAYIKGQLEQGFSKGTVDWTFSKERYDEQLYKLNKDLYDEIFNDRNEFTVTVEWSIEIN